ncbi:MAG: T6SS immunity protein Tdi1 domain-containing protein [Thermoanaerobaculia bacterium]
MAFETTNVVGGKGRLTIALHATRAAACCVSTLYNYRVASRVRERDVRCFVLPLPCEILDLTAPVTDLSDVGELAEAWEWLLPAFGSMRGLLVTALGDMFLSDPAGQVHLLNADAASATFVAHDESQWREMLEDADAVEAWFAPGFVRAIREHLGPLAPNQVYYPKHPSFLGGTYDVENYDTRRWDAYLWVNGQIHQQIKDLPPGTKVSLKFDEW